MHAMSENSEKVCLSLVNKVLTSTAMEFQDNQFILTGMARLGRTNV